MKANKTTNKYLFIKVLSLCSLFISCSTIHPESPKIEISEIEILEQEASMLKVPIRIDLAPYFKETEKSVPKTFKGSEQTCDGVSYSYKFNREPIHFKGTGERLFFDVNGKYSLNLNYCPTCTDLFSDKPNCVVPRIYASCGVDEAMRKIHVAFETQISLSKNYQLVSRTKLKEAKALSPCEITVFSYDATKTLEEEVSKALSDVEKTIDSEISSINLKPEIQAAWDLLQAPTDLDGYGFLYIRPSNISLSEIKFKGDTAYFNALLEAFPTIYTQTTDFKNTSLPALSKYTNRDGFDIHMDIFAGYDSLSAILTKNIQGLKVDLNGKEVIFNKVEIFGGFNTMIHLKVEFSGSKKGILYLTGTPEFNASLQHISFPDLNFDLETKSVLLKSAKWLFNKKITDALRSSSAIDLKPYLDSLKMTLTESLNTELSKGVFMKGTVKKIEIKLIHPETDQLHMRIHSLGNLELIM